MENQNIIHVGARRQLPSHEIIMLKADVNYTNIMLLNGSSLIVATTLGKIAERITHLSFFRPNRSTIINLAYLKNFDTQDLQIMMQNEEVVLISRRRIRGFQKILNKASKGLSW